jgi:hypothetical protein
LEYSDSCNIGGRLRVRPPFSFVGWTFLLGFTHDAPDEAACFAFETFILSGKAGHVTSKYD